MRSSPSMKAGRTTRTLSDGQPIVILHEARGERLVVGDQTWAMAIQDWSNVWYQIDGGFVYAGYVFIPRQGELDAIADRSASHWIDVDLNAQTANAMVGDRSLHTAAATTGKPGYETPGGEHTVQYRKYNETMSSAQAAIQDPAEQYNVKNVLYTQYFDGDGDAIHLNYWQPESAFGRQRTSHGCVGLQLHDAQFFWLFATSGTRVNIHPTAAATPTSTATPAATETSHAPVIITPKPAASATADPGLSQRFTRNPSSGDPGVAATATVPSARPPIR